MKKRIKPIDKFLKKRYNILIKTISALCFKIKKHIKTNIKKMEKGNQKRIIFIGVMIFLLGVVVIPTFLGLIDESELIEAYEPTEAEVLSQETQEIMESLKEWKEKLQEAEAELKYWRQQRSENIETQTDWINQDLGGIIEGNITIEFTTEESEQSSTEVKTSSVDINKLAYAIATAETSNCTKGTGVAYNNCFGIKNGSIAPCEKQSSGRFCIYNDTSESFDAFKKIWTEGYGGGFPTHQMAKAWTGNDHPTTWLNNVKAYYYS